jgi:acyl-CoA oxidase
MTMNADLRRERAQATFRVEQLTHLLDGGSHQTQRRRQLEALIARDPTGIFANNADNAYLHRTERHVRSLAKHVRLVELCRQLGIGTRRPPATHNNDASSSRFMEGDLVSSEEWPTFVAAVADDLPTALHWIMFVPNIRSLCDDAQQAEWLPLCRDWKMIGCYAQTELGHVCSKNIIV